MKKLVVYLCTGVLVLSITACGSGDEQGGTQSQTGQSTEQNGGAPTSGMDNVMEDIGATQSSAQGTVSTDGEAQSSTEGAANGNGTSQEIPSGDGAQSSEWSEEMQAVRRAIVEALGENYWPNTQVTPEMLEGTFGITPDMYEDYLAEVPMMSTNVDTLLIIKAKDGMVKAVEEALNAYRENLVNDTMQYPMNLGKIQASRIEKIGPYLCFVQLGADVMDAMDRGEEAVIAQCQEQNELVIEILYQNLQYE